MTTESALLEAIIREPDDDTPRLVYADWLDENSAEDRVCTTCRGDGNGYGGGKYAVLTKGACPTCRGVGRVSDGRRKRAEFIRSTGPGSSCHDNDGLLVRYFAGTVVNALGDLAQHVEYDSIRYGFVDWIRIPLDKFMYAAGRIFSRHPIRSVFLNDRQPNGQRVGYWMCVALGEYPVEPAFYDTDVYTGGMRAYDVPPELFKYLAGNRVRLSYATIAGYQDVAAANKDMNSACLAYGREQARKAKT